ncbi:MAG: 2Fe-2S iron-sulfur cluster binding domain-containing protein [Deltaproteobacteria bacterium]|nr:2Fe-2S iron-sulfur cluster binding domain-containing protein [Deltaproteobacteria bacterium]
MAKITFKNTGESFEVPIGTSVLECAIDHSIPLPHDCGGNCACTTCQIWVEEGAKNLNPMSEDERGLLEANDKLDEKSRLGCQSRIQNGEVVVRFPE